MKKLVLQSIFIAGIISNTNAQNQYFPQDNNFEVQQSRSSSKSLRLQQIKAKLNRLKSKRNQNKINSSNYSDNQTTITNRVEKFQNNFDSNPSQFNPEPIQRVPHFSDSNRSPQNQPRDLQHNIDYQSIDSRRAFSKRSENRQSSYDTALVRSCENAGNDLTLRGAQGEKARNFYSNKCDQLISRIAIQHRLDNLLDIQGKYLSLKGRHEEANRYITLAYQQAPSSLDTNIAMIKNLVSLGQASMAEEMLLFYIGEKGIQNLNPQEHQSLKNLHQQLKRMQ